MMVGGVQKARHMSRFFIYPVVSAIGFSLNNLGFISTYAITLFISILGKLKFARGPSLRLYYCLTHLFIYTYVIEDLPSKRAMYKMSEKSLCTCVRRATQCAGGSGKSHT
jgi:hypothetical protein